jgi:hypothetical protein
MGRRDALDTAASLKFCVVFVEASNITDVYLIWFHKYHTTT